MSRTPDQQSAGQGSLNAPKPWTRPELRKIEYNDDEIAALRGAEDPIALLLRLTPELNGNEQD